MNKQQVIERFCKLASKVATIQFKNQLASDCFCGNNPIRIDLYQFEEEVIQFIENTVDEKLNKPDTQ